MRKPIESSPRFSQYKSFDRIALALIQTRSDLFEKPGKAREITMRSLGAKIGELDRGKTTWWLKREAETNSLIELLGIDRDELGLHLKTGRHIIPLLAFPDFPPLDLMREGYWSIATPRLLSADQPALNERYTTRPTLDRWLSPQGTVPFAKKVEWLYIPDGIEYLLLTRRLDATGRHQLVLRSTLGEVIAKDIEHVRGQAPLILAIQGSAEADHLEALISYRDGAPLLIISPTPLPDLWPERDDEKGRPRTVTPEGINSWTWTFLPNWRELLSQWLERRMRQQGIDNFFSSGATLDLLDQFDPGGTLFVGVNDVLALCQAVSEAREKDLKAITGSDGDIDKLLGLLFNRDKASLGLILPLIERRWTRWDLAWEGGLDQQTWIAIADGLCQFDTMLGEELIAQGMQGFDFKFPIIIRLLLRSQLMVALRKGELRTWGPACFDNQRRPLVDAALDAMSIGQLEVLAAQLMEAPASAAATGAGEALFTAVGRRIIREEDIGNELPALATHVLKQLSWEGELLYPCARPLATMTQQLEWINACWAWSLVPAPPPPCRALRPNWFFPGWCQTLPQTVPRWIADYASNSSSQQWERMALPMRDFLSVITRWLARYNTPPTYGNTPLLFNAGLLACAANGQWAAEPYWWTGLVGHPVAEQTMLHQLETGSPAMKRRAALAWWPSLVKHRRQQFNDTFSRSQWLGSNLFTRNSREQGYSALLNWVMEQLDKHGEQALAELDTDDRKFLLMHPAALSTPVKRQLLRSLAEDFPQDWHKFEFANLFLHYGPETAVEMEMFLDNKELGAQAAGYLWEWAPRKAELLLRKKQGSKEALRRLILASPESVVGDAIALLRGDPTLLSNEERRNWARWRLPDARVHAQDLIQLLYSETEESGS